MHRAFVQAAQTLNTTVVGPEVWGLVRPHPQQPRPAPEPQSLLSAPEDKAAAKIWQGNGQAAELFDRHVRKPLLYDTSDTSSDGHAYRAELHQYVTEPAVSPSPVLHTDPDPPLSWWARSERTWTT
ncbi:hypothetical protein [Streptomyces bacillaris]|uniref:hypothetical protein n=1 Tax=Streptomyces bacillaris TaxID=68179 RepID=UPI0036624A31